jgi:DNA-binding NarL/FixJ family response regulator
MARRNRRRPEAVRPLSAGYASRQRTGEYIVQAVTGAQAGKTYICPGCNQRIASGVAHVVAWSEFEGPQARRHWHTPCWNRR